MKVFYSENHQQHNPPYEVTEGGKQLPYMESPERAETILNALKQTDWAEILPPEDFGLAPPGAGLAPIRAVHDPDYVDFVSAAFADWQREGGEHGLRDVGPALIPAMFPPRRSTHRPTSLAGRAGYHSLDLAAPIVEGTFEAAMAAAHCALSAAEAVADGERAAFALCRPPGHHAGRDYCGGYCYFNNAGVAAQSLARHGKVAVFDFDYHAGNGTQDIFYETAEVLTISIHADPARQYPSFLGYAAETGAGAGLGFHRNFPLPPNVTDEAYLVVVEEALNLIRRFEPVALVVSAGMDIYEGDPLGDFKVTTGGIREIGRRLAALNLPTAICMEGGYNTAALGENVVAFLSAF